MSDNKVSDSELLLNLLTSYSTNFHFIEFIERQPLNTNDERAKVVLKLGENHRDIRMFFDNDTKLNSIYALSYYEVISCSEKALYCNHIVHTSKTHEGDEKWIEKLICDSAYIIAVRDNRAILIIPSDVKNNFIIIDVNIAYIGILSLEHIMTYIMHEPLSRHLPPISLAGNLQHEPHSTHEPNKEIEILVPDLSSRRPGGGYRIVKHLDPNPQDIEKQKDKDLLLRLYKNHPGKLYYSLEFIEDEPLSRHLPPISLAGNLQHDPIILQEGNQLREFIFLMVEDYKELQNNILSEENTKKFISRYHEQYKQVRCLKPLFCDHIAHTARLHGITYNIHKKDPEDFIWIADVLDEVAEEKSYAIITRNERSIWAVFYIKKMNLLL